jgi:C4-dicarboxylate-specific signal transduction histidine kinase
MALAGTGTRLCPGAEESVSEAYRLRDALVHVSRIDTLGELAASIAHQLNQPLPQLFLTWKPRNCIWPPSRQTLEEARAASPEVVRDDDRANAIVSRVRQFFKRREVRKTALYAGDLL